MNQHFTADHTADPLIAKATAIYETIDSGQPHTFEWDDNAKGFTVYQVLEDSDSANHFGTAALAKEMTEYLTTKYGGPFNYGPHPEFNFWIVWELD